MVIDLHQVVRLLLTDFWRHCVMISKADVIVIGSGAWAPQPHAT